jgi:hypothetical protein
VFPALRCKILLKAPPLLLKIEGLIKLVILMVEILESESQSIEDVFRIALFSSYGRSLPSCRTFSFQPCQCGLAGT